jgi:hypothetical protein
MFCEKCGSMIDDGSSFCPNCGANFEDVQQPMVDNPMQNAGDYQQPPKKNIVPMVIAGVVCAVVVVGVVVVGIKLISGGGGKAKIKKKDEIELQIAKTVYNDMTDVITEYNKKKGEYPEIEDLVDKMDKYEYDDFDMDAIAVGIEYSEKKGTIDKIYVLAAEDADDVSEADDDELDDMVKGYSTKKWEEEKAELDDIEDADLAYTYDGEEDESEWINTDEEELSLGSQAATANLSSAKAVYNAANTACTNNKAKYGAYPTAYELAELLNGDPDDPTSKLVTISKGTSVGIVYEDMSGYVEAVWVSSDKALDTYDGKNVACYMPTVSGNAATVDAETLGDVYVPHYVSVEVDDGGRWYYN